MVLDGKITIMRTFIRSASKALVRGLHRTTNIRRHCLSTTGERACSSGTEWSLQKQSGAVDAGHGVWALGQQPSGQWTDSYPAVKSTTTPFTSHGCFHCFHESSTTSKQHGCPGCSPGTWSQLGLLGAGLMETG